EHPFPNPVEGQSHNVLRSTKLLGRLTEEVRRREKIGLIFPNRAAGELFNADILIVLDHEELSSTVKYIKFVQ
ncbi:transposase, partial [Enterococcus lactis]|uniref:transposase n=1 Tax=Enterococcus lactis TaxID=357441 RepID=UPI001C7D5626